MSGYVPRVERRGGARAIPAKKVRYSSTPGSAALFPSPCILKTWGVSEADLVDAANKHFSRLPSDLDLQPCDSYLAALLYFHPRHARH